LDSRHASFWQLELTVLSSTALAGAKDLNSIDFSKLGQSDSLIITGEKDKGLATGTLHEARRYYECH